MITVEIVVSPEEMRMLEALKSDLGMRVFLETQGKNMVAQVRRNITTMGAIAGEWPKLSAAYAKRKREGKTPGHGKNTYAELKDTGELYRSIQAVVEMNGAEMSVGVTAVGQSGSRPSNSELLRFHAEGAGHLPKRNAVDGDKMETFRKRFTRDLEKFLAGAGNASTDTEGSVTSS